MSKLKIRAWMRAWGIIGMMATQSLGQSPVIASFQGNGQHSWTNAVDSNALYRVEWAAQADGPRYWNLDNIGSMDGHRATQFIVQVPMFYRVVMATHPLGRLRRPSHKTSAERHAVERSRPSSGSGG